MEEGSGATDNSCMDWMFVLPLALFTAPPDDRHARFRGADVRYISSFSRA